MTDTTTPDDGMLTLEEWSLVVAALDSDRVRRYYDRDGRLADAIQQIVDERTVKLRRQLEDANVTIRAWTGVPITDALNGQHLHVFEDRWHPADRRTVRRTCVLPGCHHTETKEPTA